MTKLPHKYRDMGKDQLEEHFSNYLFNDWSFSKVNSFSRNQKSFEMSYIYNIPYRRSASEVAGSAYHSALKAYFTEMKEGNTIDVVELQQIAYDYISEVWGNDWKLQKTTPTVEECQKKAITVVNALINNFLRESGTYLNDISEIISVEQYIDEFITVNGVDIPLPCHGKLDLVVRLKSGDIVIIDHKSKSTFSDEKELAFSIGKQAITYAILYETNTGERVHGTWFIENKYSENKDKSPQLNKFEIILDSDKRKLYEALLYEPLRSMLQAVSDPDYVYLVNDSDNFVDKAEVYDFWARTMIAEVDDFRIPDDKKELISKRLRKIRNSSLATVNPTIIKNFQKNASAFIPYDLSTKDMTREEKIVHTLRTLGIVANVSYTFGGYSSDTFLIDLSVGTKLADIFRYKLDIASALNVESVRINPQLYVHEGRSYISVEAGKKRERFLPFDPSLKNGSKIPLGRDNFDNLVFWDTDNPSTPHVLICGSTGSGKSVSIVSIIEYAKLSGIDDIVIFDPKREFTRYSKHGVDVYNDIEDIESAMELLVEDMQSRVKSGSSRKTLVIFDEFADAVSNSRKGENLKVYGMEISGSYKNGSPKMKRVLVDTKKSLEENLRILLQKGRSSGFRIIAATQRASVKVITGDAKVNFPVQICFKVPKEVDSKVVLDEAGAESLAGQGDGLIKSPEYNGLVRFQSFYLSN